MAWAGRRLPKDRIVFTKMRKNLRREGGRQRQLVYEMMK